MVVTCRSDGAHHFRSGGQPPSCQQLAVHHHRCGRSSASASRSSGCCTQVHRVLRQVYRVLRQVQRALRQVHRALRQVHRPLKQVQCVRFRNVQDVSAIRVQRSGTDVVPTLARPCATAASPRDAVVNCIMSIAAAARRFTPRDPADESCKCPVVVARRRATAKSMSLSDSAGDEPRPRRKRQVGGYSKYSWRDSRPSTSWAERTTTDTVNTHANSRRADRRCAPSRSTRDSG